MRSALKTMSSTIVNSIDVNEEGFINSAVRESMGGGVDWTQRNPSFFVDDEDDDHWMQSGGVEHTGIEDAISQMFIDAKFNVGRNIDQGILQSGTIAQVRQFSRDNGFLDHEDSVETVKNNIMNKDIRTNLKNVRRWDPMPLRSHNQATLKDMMLEVNRK